MKFPTSDTLGLAFTDRDVACARLDGRGRLVAAARLRLGEGERPDRPDVLGARLKDFLAQNGLAGASAAVAGVPARWLLAEPRDVPPADEATQMAALRLAAERISLGDDARLAFDVAGPTKADDGGPRLLVGLAQRRLDDLRRACEAAGVRLAAVTATGLAVAGELPPADQAGRTAVLFDGDDAEIVGQTGGRVRTFRHAGGAGGGAGGPALWRALALVGGGDVLLLDARHEACAELGERLRREVACREPVEALRDVPALAALNGQAGDVRRDRLWPAVVLAHAGRGAGRRGGRLPIDFLHPRLAAPKPPRVDRRWLAGAAVAVLALGGLGLLYQQVVSAEALEADLNQSLAARQPDVEAARAEVARIGYGRTFFGDARPPTLACLDDLARVVGRDAPVWVTNLTIRDAGRAQLQGRSADQQSVLALRDRLVADPAFSGVQLIDLREASGTTSAAGEMTFSLQLTYGGPTP